MTKTSNLGIVTVINQLNSIQKILPTSGQTLHAYPGILSKATAVLTASNFNEGEGDVTYTGNLLTLGLGPPGTRGTYNAGPEEGYSPVGDWILTYEISAANNVNGSATGEIQIKPWVEVRVTFQYYVKLVDGAAWYAYEIDTLDTATNKWINGPISSIGNSPAARAT